MLEEIKEIIKETIRYGLKRKDALFITKKVVGQAGILRKSVRIIRISSKNGFFNILISKQANTLQSMKELIMNKMMIQKVSIMQQRLY